MIVSSVSVPLVGLVGTGVMGHLDDEVYLAAVAAAVQVFSILFVGFNFLRMGTTGITAQAHGSLARDPEAGTAIRQTLGEAVILALLLGALIIVLQVPIRNAAFSVLGADARVTSFACQYFNIRVWSAPATLFNFAALGWLLGMQNARGPLAITLVINLTNVALDLWFVLGLGLKVRGVATGALLAELAGAGVATFLLVRELRRYPGSWARTRLLDLQAYRALLRINGNLFIRTIALMFTFAFMTAQGARMGSVFLAANALLINFQWFTSYALDGIANAAEALGKLRAVHARTVLEDACRDDDVTVRAKAVWAVSIIGPLAPSSQATLLAATTDLSPEVRAIAADSIATHAGDWPNALDALIPLISDGNTDIAVRAMQALHQFQTYSEAAIEAVTLRLNGNQDSRVQSAAALTLSRMGSTAAQSGDELARLALAGDAEVREAAMRALAVLQLPESVGAFVAGLRDDEAEVRKIASAGLLKANQVPDDDVATVIEALRDPETRVRTNAATVIGRMDPIPSQAIPYLIESAVESDDDGLRLAATLALRNADSAVPQDIMRRLLQDKNQRVQLAAAAALLHTDAADALVETIIWTALVDTNWRVREIAISMLEFHPEAVTAYRRDLELWVVKESDQSLRERVERLLNSTSEPPVVELTTAS